MKKTYLVLADSRQLKKKQGETVELLPAAAKYLVNAGVLEEVVELQPRELAEGETLQAAELPEGSTAVDVGPAEPPASPRRKRGED